MCARCHREKKNLRATLRSGSELISLSDRILLLVACRPRVRVKRACAVGMARRGAQKGRLGAPCKAGGHCWPLTHGCRCRRVPQIRAMGDSIGRAAPPHERSQPRTAHEPRRSDVLVTNGAISACNQSERSTHLPGYAIRATRCESSKSCRNGSQPPRSADRRLRDGPRRRHECPWTMPGGSWSMENRGLAQGGAWPFPSKSGGWDMPGFFLGGSCYTLGVPRTPFFSFL